MSELKLLPCPFCGGEAKLIEYKETVDGRGDKIARIRCECGSDLHLTAREFSKAEDDFGYKGGYYSQNQKFWNGMHQRLIDKWNTRTPMDNIVEKLEEKTEFLKDCTKYGNESAEQQEKSYSTMMMYEVADLVDDLIDIVKQEINNGLE